MLYLSLVFMYLHRTIQQRHASFGFHIRLVGQDGGVLDRVFESQPEKVLVLGSISNEQEGPLTANLLLNGMHLISL